MLDYSIGNSYGRNSAQLEADALAQIKKLKKQIMKKVNKNAD